MSTKEIRQEANALLASAETSLEEGNIESFEKQIVDAKAKMEKADQVDAATSELKALKGDFNKPVNTVPVASKDVEAYDANDNTSRTKASYKPASWVPQLPAMSQPLWVQDKMGVTEKEQAQFQTDTFTKWLRSPSDDVFWKTASVDEVKAMQEDTDAEGGYVKVARTLVTM